MNIVVLSGGLSIERDVSLCTGSLVAQALIRKDHNAVMIDVIKDYDIEDKDYKKHIETCRLREAVIYSVNTQAPDVKKIRAEFLQTKLDLINSHKVCFIDANLSYDSLKFLLENVKIPTMLDPVSVDHCKKLTDIIHLAHSIKPNEKELEALSGISPDSESNLKDAKNYFIESGVKEVFFSLGERGLYYGNKDKEHHIKHKIDNIVNTNGAGDCMMAGLIYGKLNNLSMDETAKFGVAAACITLQSPSLSDKDLSLNNIQKKMEEIW